MQCSKKEKCLKKLSLQIYDKKVITLHSEPMLLLYIVLNCNNRISFLKWIINTNIFFI